MYLIEMINKDQQVVHLVHVERDGRLSFVAPTRAAYGYVSKWRVRERAQKIVARVELMHRSADLSELSVRLATEFGGIIRGSKSTVPELKFNPKGIRG